MKVVPVAITQVDWNSYMQFCIEHGRGSPAAALDAHSIPVGDLNAFLSTALDEDPRKTLTAPALVLASAAFLVQEDAKYVRMLLGMCPLLTGSEVCEDGYIINGTLLAWRLSAIDLCKEGRNGRLLAIMNTCVIFLERAAPILSDYSKDTRGQLFTLRRKQ